MKLQGYVFGFLTVIDRASEEETKLLKSRSVQWKCECICGNTLIIPSNQLFSGKTRSCGCKTNELSKETLSIPVKEKIENIFFNSYKSRSTRDKREFSLSKEEFIKFIYSDCFYCKSKPNLFFSKKNKRWYRGDNH